MGVVLGFLGPLGLAIGVGLMLYGLYELATNWSKMSDVDKARAAGGVLGGLFTGGRGAKRGAKKLRRAATPKPKVKTSRDREFHCLTN